MGYFKEKDIEQKELLERAMEIVKDVDDSSWMISDIIHGFQGRDGLTRDTALITLGRLYERMDAFKTKAPTLISNYRAFKNSMCTDNEINVERTYDFVKAPHGFGRYMGLCKRMEDVSDLKWKDMPMPDFRINTKPFVRPKDLCMHEEDHYNSIDIDGPYANQIAPKKPKAVRPKAEKKAGRPKKTDALKEKKVLKKHGRPAKKKAEPKVKK